MSARLRLLVVVMGMGVASCRDVNVRGAYCTTGLDCTADHVHTYCDTTLHACRTPPPGVDGGMSGGDLGSGGDGGDMAMVLCHTSSDCTDDVPICASGVCRACQGSSDDSECSVHSAATPHCMTVAGATNKGRCVECVPAATVKESAECAQNTGELLCETDGTCAKCTKHGDCSSGVCILDAGFEPLTVGTCAIDVAYVDGSDKTLANCQSSRPMRDGTSMHPYCDIAEALSATPAATFVHVAASMQPYGSFALNERSVMIVGPGKAAGGGAKVASVSGPATGAAIAVTASGTSTAHTVVIDGLDVGSGTAGPKNGVTCVNGAAAPMANVILRNTSVHSSLMDGIDSSQCQLTIDSSIIGVWGSSAGNVGGGVYVSKGTLALTNSILSGNGAPNSSVGGVALSLVSQAKLGFLTLVGNRSDPAMSAGAVETGGLTVALENSIVTGNSKVNTSQLSANCSATSVVTATSDADVKGTAYAGGPTFVDASDNHLVKDNAANKACCVDKASTPSVPNANHDVDSNPRPIGNGYDIGAQEVQ